MITIINMCKTLRNHEQPQNLKDFMFNTNIHSVIGLNSFIRREIEYSDFVIVTSYKLGCYKILKDRYNERMTTHIFPIHTLNDTIKKKIQSKR